MTVPTYDHFVEPILRFLAEHPEGVTAAEAHEAAANALGLSEEARSERLPSGVQKVYKNRSGWAHDRLKRAGFSFSPKFGHWQLTEDGQKYAAENPSLTAEQVQGLVLVSNRASLSYNKAADGTELATKDSAAPKPLEATTSATESPEERLESALAELTDTAQNELLEAIMQNTPAFFEQLVLDVLHKMGYGVSRKDIDRVGKSNDGGIDGVISLDRLGLEKVYVQAKRWQGKVGREAIQAFYGALAGQRARKGVFITTSGYTSHAIEFANSVEGVILIDGEKLTQLMIDFEVGITPRLVRVPKVDLDYFEE